MLHYFDADRKESLRAVAPVALIGSTVGKATYLEARCSVAKAIRTFRFDRIESMGDPQTGEVVEINDWLQALQLGDTKPYGAEAVDQPTEPLQAPVGSVDRVLGRSIARCRLGASPVPQALGPVALTESVMIGAALLMFLGSSAAIQSDIGLDTLRMSDGVCAPGTHTAEGPIGSDLTKTQARFYCDSVVTTMVDEQPGHFMIMFTAKKGVHRSPLGFAGYFEKDGLLHVYNIYFEAGVATAASDGTCQFFSKLHKTTDIVCGAISDVHGTRSVAVVNFHFSRPN